MTELDTSSQIESVLQRETHAEQLVDNRIAEIAKQLEQTRGEMDGMLERSEGGDTPKESADALSRLIDSIMTPFVSLADMLLGRETAGDTPNPQGGELAERLQLQAEELGELQAVRQDMVSIRDRLQALQGELSPEWTPEQQEHMAEIRGEVSTLREIMDALLTRIDDGKGSPDAPGPSLEVPDPAPEPQSDYTPFTPENTPEVREIERVLGDPELDAQYWDKQGDNPRGEMQTCAVVSQEMILDKFTGDRNSFDEGALLEEARGNGWFIDGAGTPIRDIGKLLETHGVRMEQVPNDNIQNLVQRLASGQEAVVTVNAGMLWNDSSAFGDGNANHAVWVTGARVVERDGVTEVKSVFINDSAQGRVEVPVEEFEKYWATGGKFTAYATPPGG